MPPPPSATAEAEPTASRFPTFRKVGRGVTKFSGNLWRRTRRGLLWLVIILVAAHISLNLWASLQLNRELGTIRQRGEPLTLAELVPPPVPDAQNAAKFYQRANAALPEPAQRILSGHDSRHETLNRKELATCQTAIALTRQAAAMPQCSFPHKLQDPYAGALPQLPMLRQLARLMHQQAQQEAQDGQSGPALSDTRAIFQISHHVATEPSLIGWLTAVSVESVGYRTLDEILAQVKLNPTQGRAVLHDLPSTDWSQALNHAMLGERAMGLWAFEIFHNDPATLPARLSSSPGEPYQRPSLIARCFIRLLSLIWSPMSKLDEIQYLRFMQRTTTHDLQPPFAAQTTASIEAEDHAIEAEDHAIPAYALITRIIAPVYSRVLVNLDRIEALSQLAEVAVAINVYRTAKGHYPATLKDAEATWGQPLPLDPYSHQPFIYHLQGANFSSYSVGPNGKDDGGVGNSNDKDDIRLTPLHAPLPGAKG